MSCFVPEADIAQLLTRSPHRRRESNVVGTNRPMAFAVLRWIDSSNWVRLLDLSIAPALILCESFVRP